VKLLTFLVLLSVVSASGYDIARNNLSDRWKIYENDAWRPFLGESNSIHFMLLPDDKGNLRIAHHGDHSVFINNNLVFVHSGEISWSLDSLKSIYVFPITISVVSKKGVANLSTSLEYEFAVAEVRITRDSFLNAITIFSLVLLGALIVLFFTNGVVMMEYFNFVKIFAVRPTDESALVQRITAFNNIFVYAFLSVLISVNFAAMGVGQFRVDPQSSWVEIMIAILKISAIVLMIFLIKIILINISAGFFKLTEMAPNQFFNFVRLLLGCFVLTSVFQLFVFISDGELGQWHSGITAFLLIALLLYLVTTFLRLVNKGGFTVFHLFSYICISEIFPVLLLLNIVLFN
jgi:hypothetical protein